MIIKLVLALSFVPQIGGQEADLPKSLKISGKSLIELREPVQYRPMLLNKPTSFRTFILPAKAETLEQSSSLVIPAYKIESAFCKLEWKMEKSSGVPLRFRLGTLDITNRLEGKPNY